MSRMALEFVADKRFWDLFRRYRTAPMDEAKRVAIRWMELAIYQYEWRHREPVIKEMLAFE